MQRERGFDINKHRPLNVFAYFHLALRLLRRMRQNYDFFQVVFFYNKTGRGEGF